MQMLATIANRYQSLSDAERKVADFVQRRPADIVLMSLQALAQSVGTSDATVLRFCRALGFSGYQDFKSALIPDLLREGAPVHHAVESAGNFGEMVGKYASNLSQDLETTLANLNEDALNTVVERIAASSFVLVAGLAGSAGVGRIFVDSLASIGKMAQVLSDRVEIERMAALLAPDHLLFGISHSGETEEVCKAVERARERGAATIGLTNFSPSRLSDLCDVTLLTSIPENLLGSYSCIPRIGELAVLELIVTLVVNQQRAKSGPGTSAAE